MSRVKTGPVEYGDTYLCGGGCEKDLELTGVDAHEMLQYWRCPDGHRWVRQWAQDKDQAEWRRAE